MAGLNAAAETNPGGKVNHGGAGQAGLDELQDAAGLPEGDSQHRRPAPERASNTTAPS